MLGLGRLPLLAFAVVTIGCGARDSEPLCVARQALRDAVSVVGHADAAESAGDMERVRELMDEVDRLVGTARRNLSSSTTNSVERGMIEAAEYLDFIVGDYRASGAVDGAIAQFASRELDRPPAPGESAPNC